MVVTVVFLLIAPWVLGELYREPAKTQGATQNQYRPATPKSACSSEQRTSQEGLNYVANTPGKDHRISDEEALRIAEQTDVSPRQAKKLVKEHGKAKGTEEARKQKDES